MEKINLPKVSEESIDKFHYSLVMVSLKIFIAAFIIYIISFIWIVWQCELVLN